MRSTALALLTLAGCIDEFSGSNLEFDFAPSTRIQTSAYVPASGDLLPSNIHFTFYAFEEAPNDSGETLGYLFEIQRFEIHRVIDLQSPCFIDRGEHVPFPGLHASRYAAKMMEKYGFTDYMNPPPGATEEAKIDVGTAVQRQAQITALSSDAGIGVITSASAGGYNEAGTSCDDTSTIPPPMCMDDASNQRRLAKCTEAWGDKALFEGTDRVLTQPLSGITYGFVDGINPVNLGPVGGAQFFVKSELANFDGFAIYWQYDDRDNDGQPDYPSTVPQSERTPLGKLLLFGRPESPTRGVIHVHMTNLEDPLATAELAIFPNIDEDTVHF